jgi:hypothetical protein
MRLRALIALVAFALLAGVGGVASTPSSDASFNATSKFSADLSADSPSRYLKLYSQSTDPAGLTGYATRTGSSPTARAATGSDDSLSVHLGGTNNTTASYTRVLTMETPSTLPDGLSTITVTATVAKDTTYNQTPINTPTIRTIANVGTSNVVTLGAGQKRQLNLNVSTSGLPGTSRLYTPSVILTVTYSGYTDDFLNYTVPVKVWDGTGAGSN